MTAPMALCPACRRVQSVTPGGVLARHYGDQPAVFGKRCRGSGGAPATSGDPCLAVPQPPVTVIRADGRLWYQCTGCGARWPLASGRLAHPRGSPGSLPP